MAELEAPAAYWNQSAEELLSALGSSSSGLSEVEAASRLRRFGPNLPSASPRLSAIGLFVSQFRSPIVLMLLFATGVSAVVGEWGDALVILVIVLGSSLLSFAQEHQAGAALDRLRARVTTQANVLRGGQPRLLPAAEVVPGDVVLLSAGNLVPADGILLEARDLYVSEAALTGEPFPASKEPGPVPVAAALSERHNACFMGTSVRTGTGKALIVQTGSNTAFGHVAKRLTLRPPETEFERGIRRFGYLLTEVMLVLVVVVFAANVYLRKPVLDSLLFSIALAVGLTPQLLPAIVGITLARGSQILAAAGVIVRRLESIENFGSMDTLCTDKTGTLTKGVVQLSAALDPHGSPSPAVLLDAYLNASLQTGLDNPLDEAIMAQPQPEAATFEKLDEVPYDFSRKRLSVVVRLAGQAPRLIAKGALEPLLEVCTNVQDGERVVPLDDLQREEILRQFKEWSLQGYRVLGVSAAKVPEKGSYGREDEQGLTFVGFLTFLDPPKPDTQETIEKLSSLGVSLKMITGDNHLIAEHVARSVGLEATEILTGAELDRLPDEALWHAAEKVSVFAEVDPNQKERIIRGLQKVGHVVGYLGDGINDAPALHAADVGISVDGAVDVAKEAADLVLLEQSLQVLARGISLGRTAFANTLKYVYITTSASFGNMISMAGASLFLPFLPMLPMQILLTNFLTDLPAVSIANDKVDAEALARPRRWHTGAIRDFMTTFGLVSSAFDYITFALLLLVFRATPSVFQSAWFVESVLTELLILLVVRTQRPFFRSDPARSLLLAVVGVGAVTLALPYSPAGRWLGLVPLSTTLLVALLGITLLYVTASEMAKRALMSRLHMT